MVIAPASTGSVSSKRITVIITDQTNNGIRSRRIPFQRILIIVVMKLMAPRIEATPAKCSEKIAKSTEGPECAKLLASGG
jgi:hypothetical protein